MQGAVLRECVVNLARVKESIAQSVSGTLEAVGFDSWLELMRGIKAGLLMLGKSRAVDIVDAITEQLRRVMQPGGMPLSGAYLDRLADAVVSLEYYIETLQAGRSDPWYMLDNAQACLEVLQREPEQVVPTVPAVSAANYARTVRIGPPTQAIVADAIDPESTGHALTPPVLTAAPVYSASVSDPELLSLFAEEAREELEKIRRNFPAWEQDLIGRRSARYRAPIVPHPQGERPHGRRARAERVLLGHGKSGQSVARRHAGALARNTRHAS